MSIANMRSRVFRKFLLLSQTQPFKSIKFTIMYMYFANIPRRRVFRRFVLLSRVNQYNHFLLKVFGVKRSGH